MQQDVRALRSQILLMQAECIADKLAEFLRGIRIDHAAAIDRRLHRAASV
jgi:hypothetical protein